MIPVAGIESRTHLLRGCKIMLDADLAKLYGVETKALNKAVKRNRERFPPDFMFQLSSREVQSMRFQFGTASLSPSGILRFQSGTASKRNTRYRPYAFTQEGIAMLSSVLRSQRAVRVNVEIMRAFVRLRGYLASHAELARQLAALEKKFASHDEAIQRIFNAIKQLITPPAQTRREIGFHVKSAA
ncbi:MAG: ORF6N domain-containing protein [Verrucomicrobia bacterium]|nr:ORF6N domain-containing protein [Verrucomicrobiota bacterium]